MQLISLDQVFRILKPGIPLPFGIRDAEGRLLLGRGHVVPDQARLLELLNRGMFVDAEEVKRSMAGRESEAIAQPTEKFSTRWEAMQRRLGLLLRHPGDPEFLPQIRDAVEQIAAFPDSQSDQVIFLIVRHDHSRHELYAEAHALHVAALCNQVSRRLGWSEDQRRSLIGAALTMNLSMINLQAKLAGQRTPLNPLQRKEIQAHPMASAALLRAAGLTDQAWLAAVEQHHEAQGGTGYPQQLAEPPEMSQLIRWADNFAAKHSARAGRAKQAAEQAARDLYAQSGGQPLAMAVIKECGLYPPGCFVKLASGELAVVIRRGAKPKEPLVAALTNANGEPLARPVQRDTAQAARAIVTTVAEKAVTVQVSADLLYG